MAFTDDFAAGMPQQRPLVAPAPAPTEDLPPITDPNQDAGAPQSPTSLPALPPSVNRTDEASGKFRGITDDGLAQVGKLTSGVDKSIQKALDPFRREAQSQLAQNNQAYGQIGAANDEVAAATKQHLADVAKLEQDKADFMNGAAQMEQQLAVHNKAVAEHYIGQYREQIAAVRAMTVDPTGPIGKLSTAQAGGLSMAMFAQGFLAAQGIHIDVAGQVDRWVERSIHEQERQIQQAEAGANDQLNLWQLARQSASDDLEARQRYRGFIVAAMDQHAKVDAARFNSSIADSRAKEFSARLAIEAGNAESAIYNSYFQKQQQATTEAHDYAYKQGMLAIQQREATLKERQQTLAEKIADQKTNPNDGTILYHDPGKPIRDAKGNITGWENTYALVDPKDERTKKSADEIIDLYQVTRNGVEDLKKHQQVFDHMVATLGGRAAAIASPEYRRWENKRNQLVRTVVQRLSGKTVTDKEAADYQKMVAGEKFWQVGDNAAQLDDMEKFTKNMFDATMSSLHGVRALTPEERAADRAHGGRRAPTGADEVDDNQTLRNAAESGEVVPEGAAASQLKDMRSVGANDELAPDNGLYAEFRRREGRADVDEAKRDRYAMSAEVLGDMVLRPDIYLGHAGDNSADEIRQEARQALANAVADGKSKYASYIQDRVNEALKDSKARDAYIRDLTAPGQRVGTEEGRDAELQQRNEQYTRRKD